MSDSAKSKTRVQKEDEKQKIDERKSEATSDETLSELEESEEVTSGDSIQGEPGPSPDGVLDEQDELKDAGPM
jgi:hypothetical protein